MKKKGTAVVVTRKPRAKSGGLQTIEFSRKTPRDSAKLYRGITRPFLIHHQGDWLDWDGSAYQDIEDATIEAEIAALAADAVERVPLKIGGEIVAHELPFNPKKADLVEIHTALKTLCHVSRDTMAPPVFLDGGKGKYAGLNPRNLISFKNGLLDIISRIKYPATPMFFTRTALPVKYDAHAPKPTLWLDFLKEVTKERQPLIDLLQEMLGYLISSDTSLQVVFFLWGRPRSGKGTIMRVTTALVGKRNVCHHSIEDLAADFGLQKVVGKSVLQITDMNCETEALKTAASRINAISGEDGVTARRKNRDDWDGTLTARIQMAGNNLPNFGTHTGAIVTRLLIVPFDVSFVGKEDRKLTPKLEKELAGIVNWSLDGLANLRKRGEFVEPEDSELAKKRLVYASDPIHGLVEEKCVVKAGAGVDKTVLYDVYQTYCRATGAYPVAMNKFSERLMGAYPAIIASKHGPEDKRVPCYRGVRLNDAEAVETYQVDLELATMLGVPPVQALLKDKSGWPIVQKRSDFG
jgi:putative DNA primase/helicase